MNDELLTYKDLQTILHIGKNRAYELLRSKSFPTIRIGKRLYVSRHNLEEWINQYTNSTYML